MRCGVPGAHGDGGRILKSSSVSDPCRMCRRTRQAKCSSLRCGLSLRCARRCGRSRSACSSFFRRNIISFIMPVKQIGQSAIVLWFYLNTKYSLAFTFHCDSRDGRWVTILTRHDSFSREIHSVWTTGATQNPEISNLFNNWARRLCTGSVRRPKRLSMRLLDSVFCVDGPLLSTFSFTFCFPLLVNRRENFVNFV